MTTASAAASLDHVRAVTAWHARAYRRSWHATVTTAFLNPVFFLLSIGLLLGKLVDDASANLGGLSYLEFVAPGLLAATAMQLAAAESMYSVMGRIKWFRTYDAVLATPVGVPALVAAAFAWTALRVVGAAAIFTAVAAAGGAVESPLGALAPLAALLCGLAFAAPITAIAASLENDTWLATINRFVLIPMFLFSGTFFPVEQLPEWLEPAAWATPLWHGVSLCRDLTSGSVDTLAAVHVAYLLVFLTAGWFATLRVFERRLLR